MRKVTEKTFKAYVRDAVKELNTLELTAELEITALSAEITLLRDTKEVGHISITADGWVYAKDFTRDEVFNIVPEHDTMKDLFSQIYPTVNGLLDNGWFWIETAEPQEAEQVEEVAEEPKKYFAVTFEKNGIYSANIAHAVKKSDVEAHYSKYNNCVIEEAKGYEVEEAKRKHMPIVEIEPVKEEAEKQEGRTITVTLHPENEEKEITVTYEDVKDFYHVVGQEALELEKSTDGHCIDKDHAYIVIEFFDGSEATFRRSSVVRITEKGHVVLERDPKPTPEEADKEAAYNDFKPEPNKITTQARTYVDDKVQEIRDELTKLEELEEAINVIEAELEKDSENTELDKKLDEAYKEEYQQFKKVYCLVANLVDLLTARQIVNGSRDRLKKILRL